MTNAPQLLILKKGNAFVLFMFAVAVFFLCVHVVIVAGASINIVVVCTLTSGVQFGT